MSYHCPSDLKPITLSLIVLPAYKPEYALDLHFGQKYPSFGSH
jgi:hypothetical protein